MGATWIILILAGCLLGYTAWLLERGRINLSKLTSKFTGKKTDGDKQNEWLDKTTSWLKKYWLTLLTYLLILVFIYFKLPVLWEAWWNISWLFWSMIIVILICVILFDWTAVILMFVFLFLYMTVLSIPKRAGTNENNTNKRKVEEILGPRHSANITKAGIRIHLNPLTTHTRPHGTVRYTLASNSNITIIETGPVEDNSGIDINKWWSMPAGDYIITSEELDGSDVLFEWYE